MVARIALFCVLSVFLGTLEAKAMVDTQKPNIDALIESIYQSEGGQLGELFGIHSVHYKNYADARAICKRTIIHQYHNWLKVRHKSFIEYLSIHYCPKNSKIWKKNVEFYYRKFKKQYKVS